MLTTINFFRSRKFERIDYADIILYFEKELKSKVCYSEEDVKFTYTDLVFDVDYNLYITKLEKYEVKRWDERTKNLSIY